MEFPSVQLSFPRPDEPITVRGSERGCDMSSWKLWGLTLGILNDLIIDAGLRQDPIDESALRRRQLGVQRSRM